MLERAILDTALDQLSGVGWNGPTVESVVRGVRDVRNSRPGLALCAALHECDEGAAVCLRTLIEAGVFGPLKELRKSSSDASWSAGSRAERCVPRPSTVSSSMSSRR